MTLVIQEIETQIQKSQVALEKLEEKAHMYVNLNQRSYFDSIRNSIQKLTELTQKILNQNEALTTFKYTNITYAVKEVIRLLETYLEKKHITLEFVGRDIYAQVSEEAIEHIMMNLLSNAIKYNKENGNIQVKLSQVQDEVILQVMDSGIGISEIYLNEMFTKFSRENSREEGNGLGLSIVKYLVDLHNGKIECFSKQGEGTIIQVRLPILHIQNAKSDEKKLGNKIISLSHELKTPIHVMQSALDLMYLKYKDYPELLEQIKKLRRYGSRILNRIQIMIDVQKIQENYVDFKFKTYNLVEVIENVMDVFSEGKEQGFFIFDPQEEEIYANIDLYLIQQTLILLMHLLVREDATNEWYIYLEKSSLTIDSYKNISFKALIEDEQIVHKAMDILILQFIGLILEKHSAVLYIEEKQIKIEFPECENEKCELLGEENKTNLREQMKMRYASK